MTKKAQKDLARAREIVAESLDKLAIVRDGLTAIADEDDDGGVVSHIGAEQYAFLLHAGMVEAAVDLERALVELGVLKKDAYLMFTEGQ